MSVICEVRRLASPTRREPRHRGDRHRRDKGESHGKASVDSAVEAGKPPDALCTAPPAVLPSAHGVGGRRIACFGTGEIYRAPCRSLGGGLVSRVHPCAADARSGCAHSPAGADSSASADTSRGRLARGAADPRDPPTGRADHEPRSVADRYPAPERSFGGDHPGDPERHPTPEHNGDSKRSAPFDFDTAPALDNPGGHPHQSDADTDTGSASVTEPSGPASDPRPLVLLPGRVSE